MLNLIILPLKFDDCPYNLQEINVLLEGCLDRMELIGILENGANGHKASHLWDQAVILRVW